MLYLYKKYTMIIFNMETRRKFNVGTLSQGWSRDPPRKTMIALLGSRFSSSLKPTLMGLPI